MAAEEVAAQIRREMWPEVGRDLVRVMVIPDIVEWVPPPDVAAVSATDIRRRLREGGAK